MKNIIEEIAQSAEFARNAFDEVQIAKACYRVAFYDKKATYDLNGLKKKVAFWEQSAADWYGRAVSLRSELALVRGY